MTNFRNFKLYAFQTHMWTFESANYENVVKTKKGTGYVQSHLCQFNNCIRYESKPVLPTTFQFTRMLFLYNRISMFFEVLSCFIPYYSVARFGPFQLFW